MLHGGRREIDVYRRIYTGINGTPMPAFGPEFSPAYQDEPEKIWHLTYYVLALADGREFPYISDAEATRMAAEEVSPGATEPMPEVETPPEEPTDTTPNEPENTPEGGDPTTPEEGVSSDAPAEDASGEDPREASPQPPTVDDTDAPSPAPKAQ